MATFAGGCFWCIEAAFDKAHGVLEAVSGYTGGAAADAIYSRVASGACPKAANTLLRRPRS